MSMVCRCRGYEHKILPIYVESSLHLSPFLCFTTMWRNLMFYSFYNSGAIYRAYVRRRISHYKIIQKPHCRRVCQCDCVYTFKIADVSKNRGW
jgi:hypothetical protein